MSDALTFKYLPFETTGQGKAPWSSRSSRLTPTRFDTVGASRIDAGLRCQGHFSGLRVLSAEGSWTGRAIYPDIRRSW